MQSAQSSRGNQCQPPYSVVVIETTLTKKTARVERLRFAYKPCLLTLQSIAVRRSEMFGMIGFMSIAEHLEDTLSSWA